MYVVQSDQNRFGDFEFNEDTQDCTFKTVEDAQNYINDCIGDCYGPLDLEELGKLTIYKLEKV